MVIQMNNTAPSRFVTEMPEKMRIEDDLLHRVTKKFPEAEPDHTTPSDLFAQRYRTVRVLGSGGMGVVYLMEDKELDYEKVAVKMLAPHLTKDDDALNLIAKEAKNAFKLHHPNIVCVRHYAKYEETPYIVMDYIAGKTIRQLLLEQRILPEPLVVELLAPIASALDYAHQATVNRPSVLHRDVKPENVIVQRYDDGKVYPVILDFGISKAMEKVSKEGDVAMPTRFRRTTGYAPPEKLIDAQCSSTVAQDIFSFAVMAYECLTGKLPFGIEEDVRACERMRNGDFERINIDSAFARAVEKGLSYSPDDRPKSCAEFFAHPLNSSTAFQKQKSTSDIESQPQEEVAKRDSDFDIPPHTPDFVAKTETMTALCSDYRVMLAESATLHREDDSIAKKLQNIQALLRDALDADDERVDSFLLIYLFNQVLAMRRQFAKARRGASFFMEHRRRNVELCMGSVGEQPWCMAMKNSIKA